MRKLWIAAGALLVLFAAGGIAAVWSLNRLIAGNQDRLIAQAQAALGRDLRVAHIGMSLWHGLGVRLDDVRIADDARFGSEDFVRIATLTARAKLWPLLRQRLELGRITATQPHVNLIRDAAGQWNYMSLRPLAAPDTSAPAEPAPPRDLPAATAPAPAPPAAAPPGPAVPGATMPGATAPLAAAPGAARRLPFGVGRVTIADGTVVVVDHTQAPARTTTVTGIDAALRRYTDPAVPIEVRLAATVAAAVRNIDVHASVGPWNQPDGIPLRLDGSLGPFDSFDARVESLHIVAALAPNQVHVTELTGRSFGGSFALRGDYPLQPSATLTLKGTGQDLAVAAVLEAATGDGTQRAGGTAQLTIDVRSSGTTQEAIETNLAGSVAVDVYGGIIKDLNLPNDVLAHAGGLPIIGSLVSAKIKPKYAWLFADPDTHFETLHGTFMIGGQRVQTQDLAIVATEYGVFGRGWIAFDRQMDVAGTLRMSPRFSDDVVADVKGAKYLLDDHGQLTVPFHLRGTLGEAKATIDSDDITAIVERGAARGGVKDLVDKFLGRKREATPGETKDLLEQGLRRLFGR